MTFRDDHDAALARADALARELETAKETAEDAEAELAKANADKARLAAEVAELRAQQSKPATEPEPAPEPEPEPEPATPEPQVPNKPYSTGPALVFLGLVTLLGLFVWLVAR